MKKTIIFISFSCLSLLIAFVIGISDHPPGILLCYASAASLILAFVHKWRRLRSFLILLGVSIAGFLMFVFLHNFFYALAEYSSNIIILKILFEFLHVITFITAIFLFPAALFVAIVAILIIVSLGFLTKQISKI